jgi:hypothetical protein
VAMFSQPRFNQPEHEILYRTLNYASELLLADGVSVVYDANLNRYQHRQEKYEICARTGAVPMLVWVQTPKDIAKERAVHDSRGHLIPPNETASDMFDRIAGVIEEPHPSEHAVLLDGTQLSEAYVRRQLNLK